MCQLARQNHPKRSKSKRAREHRLSVGFTQGVREWTHNKLVPAQMHVRQGRTGGKGEHRRERNYRLRGGQRGREGKRGMVTQKMVRRSNYDMPGHRRRCWGTCTHTLQNTLWRPSLSKHCLVWWKRERESERERRIHKNKSSRVGSLTLFLCQYCI